MTELEPTAAPPPLYVRGKRRPGPSRWGYDPKAPILVPTKLVEFKKPPPKYITSAFDFLTSEQTFHHRRRELVDLRKRRKCIDGRTVIYTPGLGADEPASRMTELRRPRGDHRAGVQAWLAGLVQYGRAVDAGHDLVGIWSHYIVEKTDEKTGEKTAKKRWYFVRPYSRHELAGLTGVPVKRVDVMISEAKAAGYIARRQRRHKVKDARGNVIAHQGDRATLLLTEHFYASCGREIWSARRSHLGLDKRPDEEAKGPTAPTNEARPVPWTPPEARGWGPRRDAPPEPTS